MGADPHSEICLQKGIGLRSWSGRAASYSFRQSVWDTLYPFLLGTSSHAWPMQSVGGTGGEWIWWSNDCCVGG